MKLSYRQIKKRYPEHMSLEQMRIICHISKKTARLLLQNGLVPHTDNGKLTHKYQIATTDVIEYLKCREVNPERYALPKSENTSDVQAGNEFEQSIARCSYDFKIDLLMLDEYPNVLTCQQAAEILCVSASTVCEWARKGRLNAFKISNVYHVPKSTLLEPVHTNA